jgi:hypothetical protein
MLLLKRTLINVDVVFNTVCLIYHFISHSFFFDHPHKSPNNILGHPRSYSVIRGSEALKLYFLVFLLLSRCESQHSDFLFQATYHVEMA